MRGLRMKAARRCPSAQRPIGSGAPAPIAGALPRRRRRASAVVVAAADNANPNASAERRRHVAVVGAGVGGLCVAAILARAGHRVTVYEQGERAGGRCQGEWLEAPASGRRFRFDTGPSLLLLPDAYRAAFARMTGKAEDAPLEEAAGLELRRVGPDAAYRVFFTDDDDDGGGGDDGGGLRSLDLLYDADAMVAQLDARRGGAWAGPGPGPAPEAGLEERERRERGVVPPPPPPPAVGPAYRAWLHDATRMLDAGWGAFIARDFGPASGGPLRALLRALDPRALFPLLLENRLPSNPLEMLEPHARALARRFPGDPDLQALLSFQDLYVGLSPSSAPGVFSLLAATELRDGVFYPKGGFGAVRDALLRAALEAGDVEVRTRARVRRVVVGAAAAAVEGVEVEEEREEGGRATRFVPADAVVCNADVASAYALLSGGDAQEAAEKDQTEEKEQQQRGYGAATSSRVLGAKYSAGVIAYYWCVEGGALTQLPQHTVFVRSPRGGAAGEEGAGRAWRRARSARELEREPNFYVHCPARTDPTAVSHPGACESVMVLLPVANLQEVVGAGAATGGDGDFDEALVAAGRAAILRALARACPGTLAEAGGASDLGERITREEVRSPPQWRERHALAHGAAFGLAHGLDQLAALRPALKDGRVRGFYCVGASARPGNGVPLVLTGAGLCADAVLEDLAAAAGGGGGVR